MEHQRATMVGTDGTVTDGSYPEAVGGFSIIEVPTRDEALRWAAKLAAVSAVFTMSLWRPATEPR